MIFIFCFLINKLIKVYSNGLIITESKNYHFLNSNGIPNHKTGHFPSRSNPHSISPQSHKLRITKKQVENNYMS